MTYSGFTPGLNFESAFDPSKINFNPGKIDITNLKYGSPIGGITNNSPGSFSLEGLSPEDKKIYLMYSALGAKPTDYPGLTGFMREQAGIAEGVARRKLGDERISKGIDVFAGGLQLAGGSPEMLAFNAQAPLRAQEAYVRNAQNRQRQEIPVIAPPSFMPRNYFS